MNDVHTLIDELKIVLNTKCRDSKGNPLCAGKWLKRANEIADRIDRMDFSSPDCKNCIPYNKGRSDKEGWFCDKTPPVDTDIICSLFNGTVKVLQYKVDEDDKYFTNGANYLKPECVIGWQPFPEALKKGDL